MKVSLLHGSDRRLVDEEDVAKSKPLTLHVADGDAFVQVEISERELRVVGDGGATRRGTWEVELAIPRVNEK